MQNWPEFGPTKGKTMPTAGAIGQCGSCDAIRCSLETSGVLQTETSPNDFRSDWLIVGANSGQASKSGVENMSGVAD